jgi:PAS domain S-box-containing protein
MVGAHLADLVALEAVLEPLGARMLKATSGEEALEHLRHEEFACILLDVRMPGKDGFETLELIRSREYTQHVPILFLTAIDRGEAHVLPGGAEGAVDYLVKPYSPELLRAKVGALIALYRREQRVRERERQLQQAEVGGEQQKLHESETPFRMLADSIPQLAWMADETGFIHWYNQRWYSYTGTTLEQMQGWGWQSVHDPAELPRVVERFKAAIASGEPWEDTFPLRRADGEYRWFLSRAMPVRDATGRIVRWFGTNTDVEDQRRAQRKSQFLSEASTILASSLEYEETLARATWLAVPTLADWCMVDLDQADGTFKRVAVAYAQSSLAPLAERARQFPPSRAATRGHPPTKVVLQGMPILVEEVDDAWMRKAALNEEHLAQMRAIGFKSIISIPLVARGKAFGVLTLLAIASGRRFTRADLATAEELARRAALAVDNARLYQEAQEAVRLRDEFLSVASHELKTPLTPLSLKLQKFTRAIAAAPDSPFAERHDKDLEVMRRQVKRLSDLVNDLLDVSRISTGRMKLQLEEVDLLEVVREVTARFEPEAERAGVRLELRTQGAPMGQWDRLRLEQVVTNLLSNAVKYGAGKPVRVTVEADAGCARLVVQDEGIGIEPDAVSRIFGKFERAVSERNYGGLGLGLFITRQMVEAMGGTVRAESVLGRGATFTVELPLKSSGGHG